MDRQILRDSVKKVMLEGIDPIQTFTIFHGVKGFDSVKLAWLIRDVGFELEADGIIVWEASK
jgi:hypothetical protein